jgi:signal transduction histidine kinase
MSIASTLDPSDALLRRTRVRLMLVTLALVIALVVLVGVTTAVTAMTLMTQSIDRTLDRAVQDEAMLHELFEGEESGVSGPLGASDTFITLVDAQGRIHGSTHDVILAGLPDLAALRVAVDGAVDRRDGTYGGLDIRLLTLRADGSVLEDDDGSTSPLFLQAGLNLTLQDQIERQLIMAIALIGAIGVAGAMVVAWLVTRRALVPIREAFATERRFVAAASHELQTPVAIIRASAEILERESLVSANGTALVQDILGESDRLGRLVGDLLALASAETGAVILDVSPVPVAGWFDDLRRRVGSIVARGGLRLESSVVGEVAGAELMADRDRLDQLVLILVDNAIKHSPPAGLVRLDLTVDRSARSLRVLVADEGPGIPAADLERIFEPFARVPGSQRVTRGAGLGLAIARQLAGRQGADLSVSSPPGKGATFSLGIPLAE